MALSDFSYGLRALADGQLLGWGLVLAVLATWGCALLLLVRVLFRAAGPKTTAWTLGAAALSVALTGVRITGTRSQLVALLLDQNSEFDSSDRAHLVIEGLRRIVTALRWASPALAFAMFVLLLALVRSPHRTMERRLAMLATSLALLCALALFWANSFQSQSWSCTSENWTACWFELATRSQRPFRLAARCLLGAGAVGWLVLLLAALRAARQRAAVDFRTSVFCSALLVAGVAAFWVTRAEASDAAHLVPADSDNVGDCPVSKKVQEQLPPATASCGSTEAPVVEFGAAGASIDGAVAATPDDLRATLLSKRQLWQLLNPGRKFPGVVLLGAPGATKTKELLRWLPAIEQAGYSSWGAILKVAPVAIQTQTVGLLEKRRCCSELWQIERGAKMTFTQFETLAELVAAKRESPPAGSLE